MPDLPIDFVAALEPFDSAESDRLRRYVSHADALARCAFLGEKLHYSLRMARGQPHEIEGGREDDEAVDAWLRRFRLLHLDGEATSATYIKMRGLIRRHLRPGSAAEILRDRQLRWASLWAGERDAVGVLRRLLRRARPTLTAASVRFS
jgi:hypothetical protein